MTRRKYLREVLLRVLDKYVVFVPIGIPEDDKPEQLYLRKVAASRALWQRYVRGLVAQRFRDERSAVLEAISKADEPEEVGSRLDRTLRSEREKWADTLTKSYVEVGRAFGPKTLAGFRRAGFVRKGPQDPWNDAVKRYLRQFGAQKVVDISETTRKKLRAILARGVHEGDTVREIANSIEQLYLEELIPNRSMVIARTEVLAASSLVNQEAAREVGEEMDKFWLSVLDGRERETHREAHRQRRALDEDYEVGGEKLAYPGDPKGRAENIIQCRCTEIYEPRGRQRVLVKPAGNVEVELPRADRVVEAPTPRPPSGVI